MATWEELDEHVPDQVLELLDRLAQKLGLPSREEIDILEKNRRSHDPQK